MPYNNITNRADAAPLIPEEVSRKMLTDLDADSAALATFSRVPVSRNQVRFPVLSALPVAYFVNGDTGLKQTTEVNWDNKYMNVEELACIVPVPENVIDDTDFDVWGETEPLIRNSIARTLDAAVFFGVDAPASWPDDVAAGIVAASHTVDRGTNNAAAGGLAGDLSDVLSLLEVEGFDADTIIARTTLKGLLRNSRNADGDKHPEISQNDIYGAGVSYPMRGLWPTPADSLELIAIDSMQFVIGVRSDISIKVLDQAVITDNTGAIIYNLPQQDMVATRVTFRVAWQVANTIRYDEPVEANRYPAAGLTSD
jgi:HK97 family phage major capsid protein